MRTIALLALITSFVFSSAVHHVAQAQDTATLYVYRVKSAWDTSFNPTILLDGQELARLEKGQIFGVKLGPGQHRIELVGKLSTEKPLVFSVQEGKTYYARYLRQKKSADAADVAIGGVAGAISGHDVQSLVIAAPETAKEDIKKVKPIEEKAIKNHEIVFAPSIGSLKN